MQCKVSSREQLSAPVLSIKQAALAAQAGLAAKDPVAFVAGEQRKLLVAEGKPFVFVNVVLSDSQAFVPVLDMVRSLQL